MHLMCKLVYPYTQGVHIQNHWFYGVLRQNGQEQPTMKTVEEVIEYLQMELEEAHEMHDQEKGQDKQAALYYFQKAIIIIQLLDEIKEG